GYEGLILHRSGGGSLGGDLEIGAVGEERRALVLLERGLESVPVLLLALLGDVLELVDARKADPDPIGLDEHREDHALVVLLDLRLIARLALGLNIDLG